ncbi:MAG: spore maturation protein [Clostridia bacterium]|nr:spore maturation protein [Clostridia bacterium]
MTALLLPSLVTAVILYGLCRRVNVYEAFVRGAREGLLTLCAIAPYLAAILTATALLRACRAMDALIVLLQPVFSALGLPAEVAGVVLLRPLSGSAALAAVGDVLRACGPDSRAGFLACVISGAGETVFFTASLYLGAAGVRRSRHALGAALAAYACGVLAAGILCR